MRLWVANAPRRYRHPATGLVAMSPFDLSAEPSSCVGFAPASDSSDVKWIRADGPAYLRPPSSKATATGAGEGENAPIVTALTLACTVLAIFDLFLLASGF